MRQLVRHLAGRPPRRLAVLAAVVTAAAAVVSLPATGSASPGGASTASSAGTSAATVGFTLRNRLTGQCLGTPFDNESVGVPVVQQPCDGSNTQRWTTEQSGGEVILHNVQTGDCLETTGVSPSATLFIWLCWPGTPRWRLSTRFGGFKALEYVTNPGMCADVLNASRDPGAATIVWPCKNADDHPGVDNQEWVQQF